MGDPTNQDCDNMAEEFPFEPITRDTVSSQIRAQLQRRIMVGDLAPGTRMPSERDLSEQFHVARTSVREAMQGLVSLGVIERRGNRSYVAEHLPEVIVDRSSDRKTFVAELFETRRVLEVPIFEIATSRADALARARVAAVAELFVGDLDIEEFRRLDREFHTTIAASCDNPFLVELYGKVLDQLFKSHEFDDLLSDEKNRPEVRRIVSDACTAHEAIAEAFRDGDPVAMRTATSLHLATVEQAMLGNLL
jgi:GntR family transcriptional repressor for pyruvate dehydrogenase complex